MIRFSYLPQRGLSRFEMPRPEVTPQVRSALLVFAALCCGALGTAGIERGRLEQAQAQLRKAQSEAGQLAVAAAAERTRLQELQTRVNRAEELEQSRASGAILAKLVADIGNQLPQGVWAEEVRVDRSGNGDISASASDVSAISVALTHLAGVEGLQNLALTRAAVEKAGPHERAVSFQIASRRHAP
jgi:hypothetical protein